jgi:hypothetical protein
VLWRQRAMEWFRRTGCIESPLWKKKRIDLVSRERSHDEDLDNGEGLEEDLKSYAPIAASLTRRPTSAHSSRKKDPGLMD